MQSSVHIKLNDAKQTHEKCSFVEILEGKGKLGSGRVWMLLHVKYSKEVSERG
jgi:hypothetical protein